MEERKYLIVKKSEIHKMDFNLINSDSNFLPESNNGEKIIIKWEGQDPDFINNLEWKEGPYDVMEINQIIGLPEWFSE
jgi:hypothetical protein